MALFSGQSLVSEVWTLGQIIAVTAWATSIVQFLYLEKGNLPLNCAVPGLSILTQY